MIFVNSYRSFGLTAFSSVIEPYTPVFSFNAMLENTLTNGQTVNGANTCNGHTGTGAVTFNIVGQRKFARLPFSSVSPTKLSVARTATANYATNGGATSIIISRISAYDKVFDGFGLQWDAPQFFEYYTNQGDVDSGGMNCISFWNDAATYIEAPRVPNTTIDANLNKFCMWVTRVSGSTMTLYLNNAQVSTNTNSILNYTINPSGVATTSSLWNDTTVSANNAINDYIYAAHYDRPLTLTELTNIFNSVSMLLG